MIERREFLLRATSLVAAIPTAVHAQARTKVFARAVNRIGPTRR